MRQWYFFKSKDKKVKGYCPARNEQEVARFAGYPLEELIIEKVIFDGEEFVKCEK